MSGHGRRAPGRSTGSRSGACRRGPGGGTDRHAMGGRGATEPQSGSGWSKDVRGAGQGDRIKGFRDADWVTRAMRDAFSACSSPLTLPATTDDRRRCRAARPTRPKPLKGLRSAWPWRGDQKTNRPRSRSSSSSSEEGRLSRRRRRLLLSTASSEEFSPSPSEDAMVTVAREGRRRQPSTRQPYAKSMREEGGLAISHTGSRSSFARCHDNGYLFWRLAA